MQDKHRRTKILLTKSRGIFIMKRKMAGFLFLGICIVLAILLLMKAISPIVSGCVFAVALVGFGIASRGFRK
jgi:hypothetical protein